MVNLRPAGGLPKFDIYGNIKENSLDEPPKFNKEGVLMEHIVTLNHTRWDCKYHVVFIPKYRRKALYVELRKELGQVFRSLAEQKGCIIEEGHLLADHVHMMISIPPK